MSDFCLYEWNDLDKKKFYFMHTLIEKKCYVFFREKDLAFKLSCISLYMIDELREKLF